MSLTGLDPIIHAPKRLAAMAILANSTSTDFAFLRSYLEVAESDLSKQMATLERAGYIKIAKSGRGRGSVTTYEITKAAQDRVRASRRGAAHDHLLSRRRSGGMTAARA